MAKKKIFPLAVLAIAVGAFAYAMRSDPGGQPSPDDPQAVVRAPEESPEPETGATPPMPDAQGEAAPEPDSQSGEADGEAKLAFERAEEEREAALKKAEEPPEAPPEARSQRLFKVTIQDAATLRSGDRTVRLAGVSAREPTERCRAGDGRDWPCGAVARGALMRLIRGRAVECEMPTADGPDAGAVCKVAGTDLSRWVIENGWAEPSPGAGETLQKAHAEAKDARRGLFRADAPQVSLTP
jgi:endonuclease YncB( thermonuclease family)